MPLPALLPALPWLAPFATLFRLARHEPELVRYPKASGRLVSVIVPARNEEATIETVVRSVLATGYAPMELLVVDDRSTDATARIVRELATRDARVRLVEGDELPGGWYGKPWACLQGARAARGELLLFTDADTRHEPDLLAHAVGALEAERADLVTVAPHQAMHSLWERLVMPQIWLLLGFRFHPRVVNRARRPRDVIANGQFILTTREAYDAVGTHRAVHAEVAEDLALAQAYFAKRRRLFFAFAESLMETRMYTSLPQLVEGWSKNVYLGGRRSFPDEPLLRALVPVMLALAMLFWLVPPLLLLASLAGLAPALLAPMAVATGLSLIYWLMVYGPGMKVPLGYALGYPLGAAMVLYIVLRSTWRGGRRVEWRGRVYRVADG
jgi:chlorobactene glucosyltransferase